MSNEIDELIIKKLKAELAAANARLARVVEECGRVASEEIDRYSGNRACALFVHNKIRALAPQSEQPADGVVEKSAAEMIVAGALFDFAGYLTTRKETMPVGASQLAGPMVDALKEWAGMRGLNLDDAAVLSWQDAILAAAKEPCKMTADKDALLPCPFCAASVDKPKKVGGSDERNGYNFDVVITCKCGLSISRKSRHDKHGWCNDTGQAQSEVIQAWNTRITDALRMKAERDAEREERRSRFSLDDLNVGDPCETCGGLGKRLYSNTSTWRHGIGGQAMTADVCDTCWGSGDKSKTWPSHKKAASDSKRAESAERQLAELREKHERLVARLREPTMEMRRVGWNHKMNNPHEPWDETFKAMSAELLKEVEK